MNARSKPLNIVRRRKTDLILVGSIVALLASHSTEAGTIWDGGGGATTNINLNTNWDSDVVNALNGTTAATFGTGGSTATINVNASFTGITINRDANFTIANGAGSLTIGTGGITVTLPTTTARVHTISESNLTLAGDQTWTVTNNTGAAQLSVSSIVDDGVDAYGITKAGSGTLTLSGANTYSGTTTLTAGTLNINNSGSGGTSSAIGTGTLVINGGTIDSSAADVSLSTNNLQTWCGDFAFTGTNDLNLGTGAVTLGGNRIVTVNGGNLTVGGIIDDGASSFSLTRSGAGTLTLNGANTFNGGVTMNTGGTLNIGSATALGTGTFTFSATSTFDNTSGSALTIANALTLSGGSASFTGSSDLTINGAVTLSGASRTITVDASTLTLAGVIDDGVATLSLTKAGAGTLALDNANTYGGTTTIDAGVLLLKNASALPSGNLTINGGVLGLGAANFTRTLGTGASQVQFTGTGGGFAAYGADRSVNLSSGATLTWNSTAQFLATGDTLILGAAGATHTVTFQNNINFNTVARSVQVDDGSASVDAILSGVLSGTGASGLTKTGAGTLSLSGTNTYTGVTTLIDGVLSVGTIGNGGVAGNLGQATNAAANLVFNGGTLEYTGATASTDRGFSIADSSNGTIEVATAGNTLTLGGAIAESAGGIKTLTFGGAGNITFAGSISSNSDVNITKDGTGTLTLSAGLNDLSGGAITVNRGTLNLDYTTVSGRLDDASVLVLGGGTVNLQNGASAHNEIVASTTINAGASSVTRTSGTSILRLNTITRNAGGTVNFGAASIADTDTINTNGILGPWATVNGTAYASNTDNTDGPILALASYNQNVTRLSSGTKSITNSATQNIQITDGTGTAANITLGSATTVINTLTNNATGGTSTIDPAGQTLRLAGILVPTGAGALTVGNGTNNGTLSAAASGGELILSNFSSNLLTINSVIANNTSASSLTLTGTGTTVVTNTNTYSGTTTVSAGTLQVEGGGLTATGAVQLNGGSLLLGASNVINNSASVTLNGGTLGTNGFSEGAATTVGLGSLILASDSTIDFGTGTVGTLTFSGGTYSAGTLSILNWTGASGGAGSDGVDDRLIFAGDDAARLSFLGAFAQSAISFSGFGTGYSAIQFDANYFEIVAVPEPATTAALGAFALCALIGYRERRRVGGLRGRLVKMMRA